MTIDRRHPRGPVLATEPIASLDSQHERLEIAIVTLPDRDGGPDMRLVRVGIESRSRGRASRLVGPLHARRLVRALIEAGERAFGARWVTRLDSTDEDDAIAHAAHAERARAAYTARAAARAECEPEDVDPPAEAEALDLSTASPPTPARTVHVDRPRPPGTPRGTTMPRRSP